MSISPKNEASQNNTAKRRDYISWDEYFMGIAMLSAMRSKDPNSQVGACIVRDNKILSLGYNGMPIGCDDDIMPWGREGNELETKYMYVCHSELNAILNAGKRPARVNDVCHAFPVQRVCESNHSERDKAYRVSRRQVPGCEQQCRCTTHVQDYRGRN